MKPALVDQLPDGFELARQLEGLKRCFGHGHRFQQGLVSSGMAVLLFTVNRRGREETLRATGLRSGDRWLFDWRSGCATAAERVRRVAE